MMLIVFRTHSFLSMGICLRLINFAMSRILIADSDKTPQDCVQGDSIKISTFPSFASHADNTRRGWCCLLERFGGGKSMK